MKPFTKDTKERISYGIAIASFVVGVILIFAGLFISPIGEIHGSVLGGVGTFLSFSGALLGISLHYGTELENFKSEVRSRIKKEEEKEENIEISEQE